MNLYQVEITTEIDTECILINANVHDGGGIHRWHRPPVLPTSPAQLSHHVTKLRNMLRIYFRDNRQ